MAASLSLDLHQVECRPGAFRAIEGLSRPLGNSPCGGPSNTTALCWGQDLGDPYLGMKGTGMMGGRPLPQSNKQAAEEMSIIISPPARRAHTDPGRWPDPPPGDAARGTRPLPWDRAPPTAVPTSICTRCTDPSRLGTLLFPSIHVATARQINAPPGAGREEGKRARRARAGNRRVRSRSSRPSCEATT